MRDEYFEYFIGKFGEATTVNPVPINSIHKWRDKLPDRLLEYWQNEGWNSYQNGLFSIVNPDDYESVMDEWLEDTPYIDHDIYHIIARSAFGDLYLCGERTGTNITISCPLNVILTSKNAIKYQSNENINIDIEEFFVSKNLVACDMKDNKGKPLFQRALKKLGSLAENEVYGFVPALVAGGTADINNLQKLDYSIHLSILRQFAAPQIIEL